MSSPVFDGEEVAIGAILRAIVLKQALRLYAETGVKPNRAWGPAAMMAAAREITGRQDLKARAYIEAADALEAWIAAAKIRRVQRENRAYIEAADEAKKAWSAAAHQRENR